MKEKLRNLSVSENKGGNRKMRGRLRALTVLALITSVCVLGGIFAKYVTESNRRKSEMLASSFYFTSDRLKSGSSVPSYTVMDWKENGISFEIYNYQPENMVLIADEDILYRVTAPENWTVSSVTDGSGAIVSSSDGKYTFPASSVCTRHTVKLSYTGTGVPSSASVTVTGTEPFLKELRADFILSEILLPDYVITDMGEFELVTIKANSWGEDVMLTWNKDTHSPDSTDPLMKDWSNDTGSGTVSIEPYTQTELIFFENVPQSYTQKSGSSSSVPVD